MPKKAKIYIQSAETHTIFPLLFRTPHSQRLEFRSTPSSLFSMKLVFERLKIESYHDVSVTKIGESVSSPCSGLPYKLPGRSLNTEVLPISRFASPSLLEYLRNGKVVSIKVTSACVMRSFSLQEIL